MLHWYLIQLVIGIIGSIIVLMINVKMKRYHTTDEIESKRKNIRQTKYRDYYLINGRNFTVKFTYLPNGGFHYTPTIKYQIMKHHSWPITLFGRFVEELKYGLETGEWDPEYTELSLEDVVMNKLSKIKEKTFPAETEWEKL